MKKLNILFIAFAFILASCSSDDDSSSDTSGDLVGTWIGQDVDYSGSTVTEIPGQDNLVADFVGEAYDVDYTLTFSENPNELVSEGSYSIELTTTTLGQTQVDNVENLEVLSDGTWSRTGDQLTIVSNGETSTGTILELTDTSLIVEINEVQDISQQGFTITTTVNAITTFTRM
jgi:hypothetical protein